MSRWRAGERSDLHAMALQGMAAETIAETLKRPLGEVRDRIANMRRTGQLPSGAQLMLLRNLACAAGELGVDRRQARVVYASARHGWVHVVADPGWPHPIVCRLTDAGWALQKIERAVIGQ